MLIQELASRETAHARMTQAFDFDSVVELDANGWITRGGTRASDVCVPDVLDPDVNALNIDGYPDWELITAGLTGQHSYKGPWLHDSEIIAGGVADRVMEHAQEHGGGLYVAIYASFTPLECNAGCCAGSDECDGETDIEGWAIAHYTKGAK